MLIGYWKYASFGWGSIFGLAVLWILYAISYFGIVATTETNTPSTSYFDLFVTACITQVLVCFSDWAWSLLLIIPAYALYSFAPMLFPQKAAVSATTENPKEDNHDVDKKMKASDRLRNQRLRKT